MVYEDTGASSIGSSFSSDDSVTITPGDVTVTGVRRHERSTVFDRGSIDETLTTRRRPLRRRGPLHDAGRRRLRGQRARPRRRSRCSSRARSPTRSSRRSAGSRSPASAGSSFVVGDRAADRRIGAARPSMRTDVRVRGRAGPARVASRPRRIRDGCATGTATAGPSTCNDARSRWARSRYRPGMRDVCRIEPGTEGRTSPVASTDDRLGIEKGRAQEELAEAHRSAEPPAPAALRRARAVGAARAAGPRRGGQGRHDPAGVHRSQSAGLRRRRRSRRRPRPSRARLPVADPPRAARARRHRHLQPVALRGRRRGARSSA